MTGGTTPGSVGNSSRPTSHVVPVNTLNISSGFLLNVMVY